MKLSATKVRSFYYKTMTGFTEQLQSVHNSECYVSIVYNSSNTSQDSS